VLLAEHRPAYGDPLRGGEEHQVDEGLTLGPDHRGVEPRPQVPPAQRSLPGEGGLDRRFLPAQRLAREALGGE